MEDMKNSPKDVCERTDNLFYELGFDSKTETYLETGQYLVLFDPNLNKETYQFGEDSCIDYEIIGDSMRINDIWVARPFHQRQGIGKKWVNEGLVKLAKELELAKIEVTSLSTDVAKGFWKSLDGWKQDNEINFSYILS